ncbi:hypothetical protein FB45DRAFT_1027202 [Roridomyces roridus]|uniref:F-box domain-containing protein n=1 Tax=Roridomyces roridus TaxID=1738132 RepID=A0AAD7FN46_9AGAR|nr:hypothetical protein FB45DRAFT_1027202 [Roridomyces roridus]
MASLPPEILCAIFLASIAPLDGINAYFPWILTHVCRHWRQSALAFPKLWAFIDLEQTQNNEEPGSTAQDFLETYLARSGQHPLTFRLAYSEEHTIHMHPFLHALLAHSKRWEDVRIEAPPLLAIEVLSQGDASDFPLLRRFSCSHHYDFDSDVVTEGPIFSPIPWAQLERYHEYDCSWYLADERQWEIIPQLTQVVDLRTCFSSVPETEDLIELPHLRFASFAVDRRADIEIEDVLECFDLPQLQGFSLLLTKRHDSDLLCPTVPEPLKTLSVLRLCGSLEISNEALACILSSIPTLLDFAIELALSDTDALHLFTLLKPTSESALVPNLQTLRITPCSEKEENAVNELLAMLRVRFGGGTGFSALREFIFYHASWRRVPTIVDRLQSIKKQEGWDIQVVEEWQGYLWKESLAL